MSHSAWIYSSISCGQVFKKIGMPAVKLLLIPGLTEAFFDGGLAVVRSFLSDFPMVDVAGASSGRQP